MLHLEVRTPIQLPTRLLVESEEKGYAAKLSLSPGSMNTSHSLQIVWPQISIKTRLTEVFRFLTHGTGKSSMAYGA